MESPVITYSQAEERANTISHGLGAVFAIVGCVFLIIQSSHLTEWGRVGVWVYAFSLILSFSSSSVYHGTIERRKKFLLKKLDHISIYFLISGSYSVLIMNRMMNEKGLMFLAALWGMSLVGIWFKARYVHRFKVFSTVIYVVMAYILLLDPMFFYESFARNTKILVVASGFFYTIGAGFYLWKSKKWTHFVWHIFVIIGAALHFAAVYSELIQ
ncbi:MAG: hemolysin III family protein [Flavobacteriales bacterium]|nr:hemolysin III family protein [Flavobacteriales bacterium]